MRSGSIALICMLVASCALPAPAWAVILHAREQRNTREPRGALLNSGWQYQGRWGRFLGTAISPEYFITAEHVGGRVGNSFYYGGKWYRTIATWDDPLSDLQIYRVKGRFAQWATLFKGADEVGRGVVIFGRGTQRGPQVLVNGQLKGWVWGADDAVQSWGKNVIGGVAPATADPEAGGQRIAAGLLWFSFDRRGVSYEATVSRGDSGGGVFTRVGKSWRLVGINHSTESEFSIPGVEDGTFHAAIFDMGGLEHDGRLIADTTADIPARSYITRISSRTRWIMNVVHGGIAPSATLAAPGAGVPEPTGTAALVMLAALMCRRHRR